MGYNISKDETNDEINELVEMIDLLMENGDGHLTIDVDDSEEGLKVKRYCTSDCGTKGACCQPTETLGEDK